MGRNINNNEKKKKCDYYITGYFLIIDKKNKAKQKELLKFCWFLGFSK